MFILSIIIFSLQLLSVNAQQNYSKTNKFYNLSEKKTIRSIYNSQDQITNVYYNTGADYKRYIYKYDFAERLDTVNYYYGEEGTDVSSLYKNFTNYEYNPNSLIEYQNYGGTFLTNAYTSRRCWCSKKFARRSLKVRTLRMQTFWSPTAKLPASIHSGDCNKLDSWDV